MNTLTYTVTFTQEQAEIALRVLADSARCARGEREAAPIWETYWAIGTPVLLTDAERLRGAR